MSLTKKKKRDFWEALEEDFLTLQEIEKSFLMAL